MDSLDAGRICCKFLFRLKQMPGGTFDLKNLIKNQGSIQEEKSPGGLHHKQGSGYSAMLQLCPVGWRDNTAAQ